MNRVSRLLAVSAVAEAITGIGLLVAPDFVGRLLVGHGFEGTGVVAARVAGIALLALSLTCWIGRSGAAMRICVAGMATYNLLAAAYLTTVGLGIASVGMLLWPAVLFHGVVGIVLAVAWPKLPRQSGIAG